MFYAVLGVVFLLLLFYIFVSTGKNNDTDTDNKESNTTDTEKKLPEFSGSRIRVLPVTELIDCLALQPVIENIKIHSGLSTENWNKDGLPFIHNFLSLVQRLPASECHHHAGDGGLARHTLDVAALALRQAAGRSFPPNGKTEDIPRLTAVWKYGILVAALLHDVGKVLTGFKVTLSDLDNKNQGIWLPDAGNMPTNQYYLVDFLTENQQYSAHAEIGWSFFMTLVPESTRQWIANSSPDLIILLRSYLSGKKDGSIIEELVKSADMASVSRDLKQGNRQRFVTARKTPLIETIMDTLREMLSDRGRYFTIAKDAGGDLFRKGEMIYMISKNVPDYIREYIKQNNHPASGSFPTENSRIFDTLFEYRAILPNPFDETIAITNIAVQFTKNDKTNVKTQFTVLAFNAKTLYPDGDYPTEFSGLLEVVEEKAIKPATNNEIEAPNNNTVADSTNDNKIDTNNSKTDAETTHNDTTDDFVVPPIMANPFAQNPPTAPTQEQEDDTDLAKLLEEKTTDTVNRLPESVSGSPKDSPDTENNETQETEREVSSIDDLLQFAGVLETADTESKAEKVEEEIPQADTTKKHDKKQDKSELKELKKLLSGKTDEKTDNKPATETTKDEEPKQEPKKETQDMDAEKPVKLKELLNMPRPVPIKEQTTIENIAAPNVERNFKIRKALTGNFADEEDESKRQGVKFLHWLADGLADGSISYNTPQSIVHFVEEGMLIVSPAAFKHFTGGQFNKNNPDCLGVATQKSFQTIGLIHRTRRSSFYRAFNKKKEPLFICYLIADNQLHHLIQMGSRPANNPDLSIFNLGDIYATT